MEVKKYKLGDCFIMAENGVVIKQSKEAKGLPITRIETLSNDCFNRDRLGYANVFDEEKYKHYILDDMDLIMSHINSRTFLGRTVLYRKIGNERIIHGMNVLRIKTNQAILSPIFAYYFFKTRFFKKCIDSIRKDAINQSSFALSDLKNIEIKIPTIEEQQKIVFTLQLLDKKISINKAINDNLEAMAKQLYDYWFVQFDFPNEEGKPYKSSGGAMVWNEKLKREIPRGWNDCTLGDMCEMYQPKTLGLNELSEDCEYKVYGANGIIGHYSSYNHENSEIAMACRGNSCGTINRTCPKSWITGNAMVIKLRSKEIHNEYIKHALKYANVKGAISGSGQPQLTRENLSVVKLLQPNYVTLKAFSMKVAAIVAMELEIERQNDNLTKQRDELLPLLMNGQATVNAD